MSIEGLRRIDKNRIEVPKRYRSGMRTNGIIYVDGLLEKSLESKAIQQVANVASLPGIVGPSLAMPDIHMGYGFTIGGVAAFDLKDVIVSPGGVGYDINCGVRLLRTEFEKKDVLPRLKDLVDGFYNEIPTGVGSKGNLRLNSDEHRKVLIKGATRAFPPRHPEIPAGYKETGQPVIIPGDMGRASFILVGEEAGMRNTFGSTCHGAGRLMSRNQAIKKAKGRALWREMEDKGIIVRASGKSTLAEEMPEAYKDVSNVVDVVHNAGLSKKVARLRPLGVIKG